MGAKIGARHAREAAEKAAREADRAEAYAWSVQMEGYGVPAQPSPTIAQCVNGGLDWLLRRRGFRFVSPDRFDPCHRRAAVSGGRHCARSLCRDAEGGRGSGLGCRHRRRHFLVLAGLWYTLPLALRCWNAER